MRLCSVTVGDAKELIYGLREKLLAEIINNHYFSYWFVLPWHSWWLSSSFRIPVALKWDSATSSQELIKNLIVKSNWLRPSVIKTRLSSLPVTEEDGYLNKRWFKRLCKGCVTKGLNGTMLFFWLVWYSPRRGYLVMDRLNQKSTPGLIRHYHCLLA